MEATLQNYRSQQFSTMQDSSETVKIISELLKKYFLPVHVEVLCRGFKKLTGSDLPFRLFGFATAADFLRDGCGGAFEVTQSQTEKSVFYVAPKNSASNGTSLTLKRDSAEKIPSESEKIRKVLQMLNQGNTTASRKRKSVPIQFRQYLRYLMSRHPSGITAEGLVNEFLRVSGSPLSYEMYGYPSYLEMFKDLSDVFTIREADGESIVYPASELQKQAPPVSQLKSPGKTFSKPGANAAPKFSPNTVRVKPVQSMEALQPHDVGKIELESGGSLVYVRLNGNHYIPTPCLASLAGMQSDGILKALEDQHIEVQGVEVLRESVQEHMKLRYEIALVNCPLVVTKEGALIEEISLVPAKSVAILLLVFGLRMVELESCLRKIEENIVRTQN